MGDLECVCMKVPRDLPTLVLVMGAYSKTKIWKQTNGSSGFKNKRAPKIYLKQKFNLTMILTEARPN